MVHDHISRLEGHKQNETTAERVARMSRARVHFNNISANQAIEADRRNKRQFRMINEQSNWARSEDPSLGQENVEQIARMYKAKTKFNDFSKNRLKQEEERRAMRLARLSIEKKLQELQSEVESLRKLNDELVRNFGVGHQTAKLIQHQDEEYAKLKKRLDQLSELRAFELEQRAALKIKMEQQQRQAQERELSKRNKSFLHNSKDASKQNYTYLKLVEPSDQETTLDGADPSTIIDNNDNNFSYDSGSSCLFSSTMNTCRKRLSSNPKFDKSSVDTTIIQSDKSIERPEPRAAIPLGIRKTAPANNNLQKLIALKAAQKLNLIDAPTNISANRLKPSNKNSTTTSMISERDSRLDKTAEISSISPRPCERTSTIKKSVTLPRNSPMISFIKKDHVPISSCRKFRCDECNNDLHEVSLFSLNTTVQNGTLQNRCHQLEKSRHNSTGMSDYDRSASSDGMTLEEVSSSSMSLSSLDMKTWRSRKRSPSMTSSSSDEVSNDSVVEIGSSFFTTPEDKSINEASAMNDRILAMLRDVEERSRH